VADDKIIVQADPDMVDEVKWYEGQLKEFLETLGEAIEKRDMETIEDTGHRMKGSGVSFGFDMVSEIGKSFEEAAKNKDMQEIRKWSAEFARYIECVEVIYDQ